MNLPHTLTLPSGATMTVLSVEPSPAELRGFEVQYLSVTTRAALRLYGMLSAEDYRSAMDNLTRLANDAHEQQEADEERDRARHRCGADIFSSPSSPS